MLSDAYKYKWIIERILVARIIYLLLGTKKAISEHLQKDFLYKILIE